MKKRCTWGKSTDLMLTYHDNEGGFPKHDDKEIYEILVLEGMQAGLSWNLILQKRENIRIAFDDFDYEKIAIYTEEKIEE